MLVMSAAIFNTTPSNEKKNTQKAMIQFFLIYSTFVSSDICKHYIFYNFLTCDRKCLVSSWLKTLTLNIRFFFWMSVFVRKLNTSVGGHYFFVLNALVHSGHYLKILKLTLVI